jgi:hypothetical protein
MSDKLTVSDISIVNYQADITSGQHRKNYANIRNRHNALCDSLAASTIGTTNAETTAARPYDISLDTRLNTIGLIETKLLAGGIVSEKDTPNMTVKISAFKAVVGGVSMTRGFASWSRVTTTMTITENNHGFSGGETIYNDSTLSGGTLGIEDYVIASVIDDNNFTITCNDSGSASGSLDFSRYSGTISGSASAFNRLDYVVINSDATITVLTGSVAPAPVFPSYASNQCVIAALVVEANPPLNNEENIFNFVHSQDEMLPDIYISANTELNLIKYTCNNCIIDAAITVVGKDASSYSGFQLLSMPMLQIQCAGNYYDTVGSSFTVSNDSDTVIGNAGSGGAGGDGSSSGGGVAGGSTVGGATNRIITDFSSGAGGDGGDGVTGDTPDIASGGGGGAGGASVVSGGGAGGAGGADVQTGGTGVQTLGGDGGERGPAMFIIANNITIYTSKDFSGEDGNNGVFSAPGGQNAGSGGGGGAGGGVIGMFSKNDINFATAVTFDVSGGDGGFGGSSTGGTMDVGGGGAGGGGGGCIILRAKTYTNDGNLTATINGGTFGAGGLGSEGAGSVGSAGTVGISSQEIYTSTEMVADLGSNIMPLAGFDSDIMSFFK